MPTRAIWKGNLVFGELVCPVALHAAASTSDRVSFHILNRTGHRVHRIYVDEETGSEVDREDQVKGYETEGGEMVILEPDEIASAVPESDKVLHLEAFVPCDDVETLFFDRPYYLTPAEEAAETAFAVIRDGLAATGGGGRTCCPIPPRTQLGGPRSRRRARRPHARIRS